MFLTVRVVIAIIAACIFAAGVLLVVSGPALAPAGIWPLFVGAVGLVAVVLERQRYRSESAERGREPAGPGGGEPAALPARFQPTAERFIDPTTGRQMQVFVDSRTGERRYRAET